MARLSCPVGPGCCRVRRICFLDKTTHKAKGDNVKKENFNHSGIYTNSPMVRAANELAFSEYYDRIQLVPGQLSDWIDTPFQVTMFEYSGLFHSGSKSHGNKDTLRATAYP